MDIKIKKLFIGIQLIIYTIFMYLDIFHQSFYVISNYLKFISISICVLYVIISFRDRHGDLDRWLLLLAIMFTLISDWFLLIRGQYSYGLITFIVVHYLYLIRIQYYNNKLSVSFFLKKLFINIGISSCIILILFYLLVEVDGLLVLSLFYFVTFIMNVIQGIYLLLRGKETYKDVNDTNDIKNTKDISSDISSNKSFLLFIVGLFLFLLCDINVGIYNFTSYLSINNNWYTILENFSAVAMWMFYLPSQVLISISSLSKKKPGN